MCTPLHPRQVKRTSGCFLVVWIHLSKWILNSRSLEDSLLNPTKLSNIWSDIWWCRLGPNLPHQHEGPWNQRHLNPWVEGLITLYVNIFIPFHSFTPSLHPLPLTFRRSWRFTLLTFIRQPEEKQPAIRSPKTRSGWISFPHVEATNLPD